jgi:hypothetical protein
MFKRRAPCHPKGGRLCRKRRLALLFSSRSERAFLQSVGAIFAVTSFLTMTGRMAGGCRSAQGHAASWWPGALDTITLYRVFHTVNQR